MPVYQALKLAGDRLAYANFEQSPRSNAELILRHVTGWDRTQLILNRCAVLSSETVDAYHQALDRRLAGEPIQYITGKAPFFGRNFNVGKGCFIPRFDSEALVVDAIKHLERRRRESAKAMYVLDLCCGCGVLGLTIGAEVPESSIVLIDNDATSLRYSKHNAEVLSLTKRTLTVKQNVINGGLGMTPGLFDLIIVNPPYIPVNDIAQLPVDVREHEPVRALTDGGDGLSFYNRLTPLARELLKPGGVLIAEVGDGASSAVSKIIENAFSEIWLISDLTGEVRGVGAR